MRRLDLSSMKTVRDFASDVLETEERLDVLVREEIARFKCPFPFSSLEGIRHTTELRLKYASD